MVRWGGGIHEEKTLWRRVKKSGFPGRDAERERNRERRGEGWSEQ